MRLSAPITHLPIHSSDLDPTFVFQQVYECGVHLLLREWKMQKCIWQEVDEGSLGGWGSCGVRRNVEVRGLQRKVVEEGELRRMGQLWGRWESGRYSVMETRRGRSSKRER